MKPIEKPRSEAVPSRLQPSSPSRRESSVGGWRVLLVQAVVCVVILLILVVFRLIGGTAFTQIQEQFETAMMGNALFSDMLGTQPLSTGTSSETTATTLVMQTPTVAASQGKVWYAPENATFAPLMINRLPFEPLSKGTVTSSFGYREDPMQDGAEFHRGLDIAAPSGTPIASMYYGVVVDAGQSSSYGNYVCIDHGNGLEVLYAHCSELLVHTGTVVRAGETVAKVGSTGDSTGPHLHIEMRLNGVAYDPAEVISVENYA